MGEDLLELGLRQLLVVEVVVHGFQLRVHHLARMLVFVLEYLEQVFRVWIVTLADFMYLLSREMNFRSTSPYFSSSMFTTGAIGAIAEEFVPGSASLEKWASWTSLVSSSNLYFLL
jgi:uncharacterized protein (DUF1919 family)